MLEKTRLAHNDAADSGNPMHDDEAARALGFKAAVVPGVTIYGYITQLFIEHFGTDWLSEGYCHIRFRQPVFANEEIKIVGAPSSTNGEMLDVTVKNADGTLTTIAMGSMQALATPAFQRHGALSAKTPPHSRAERGAKWAADATSFRREKILRSFQTEISTAEQENFCREMEDRENYLLTRSTSVLVTAAGKYHCRQKYRLRPMDSHRKRGRESRLGTTR